ncbi:drug:proton antiporter [Erwinia sp. OLTSP20]|uniref:putative quinol monooxygenase n=1 Tax=unclassified Erwinia TaxID=2622719 RepID=UPI000C176531|nr:MULTISPECIES: putative quinol monooxygenase [unclassified Erwinia]PIJ48575.1 drug:proton antiporter [Erwinia sp. OAMSP11]PIJ68759.1 drug:proton antiporter [Erwinia sp. OLSSP12]PIJ79323.1 drug:proton antiporter [Erwinia sp. OLCASP19]PIJ79506.1 drug:proton antiporter [Erwinia sp. OLMTSP26]PIJ81707.1 drug:proton antiporter [Erwinia sp. OLMDSP33]
MSDKSLMIIAKFIARPGKADELQTVLSRCIEPSRAEAGCLYYDLYRSLDDQNTFLFHEGWHSQAALDRHGEQPHFTRLLADAADMLQQLPEIIVK